MSEIDDSDAEAWLRVALTPGVGDATMRVLLVAFGSPQAILDAPRNELTGFMDAATASALGTNDAAVANTLQWLASAENHVVTFADADYPRLLLQTADPPPLLYVKGRRDLLDRSALAIVGSRNASAQGAANAHDFAAALSSAGITIVSGLALGIDAAAHRGGLSGVASSVAVVGTGLDIVYPSRNRALAHELAERGALVSEFALGTPPLAGNFPRRNRLISGLARGCVVIEAALQSGSLITARFANEQGREVFALPGSIHSPLSKGCHALIKQGAKLVDSASDILEELNLARAAPIHDAPSAALDPASERLLAQLGYEPCTIEQACARAGLGIAEISALLLDLEMHGRIETLPGGLYQRIR